MHPKFGEVNFVKTSRARKISITLKPFKPIRISYPYTISFKYVLGVFEKREEWIAKSFSKIKSIEKEQTVFSSEKGYKTKFHEVFIFPFAVLKLVTKKEKEKVIVYYPQNMDVNDSDLQKYFRKVIEETYRHEAKHFLPEKVKQLANKYNFKYNNISVRNSKTRWGSCSHNNNLSFSLHLMRLPDHLIDFIILHELVHTKVKNHSKKFWDELDKVTGNAKLFTKEIKNYRISVF